MKASKKCQNCGKGSFVEKTSLCHTIESSGKEAVLVVSVLGEEETPCLCIDCRNTLRRALKEEASCRSIA